jgi:putative ATPase
MDLFSEEELAEAGSGTAAPRRAGRKAPAAAPAEVPQELQPLAARMRPRSLEEVVGQRHILGAGKMLRRLIEADRVNSIILYGPPGVGKTTLAQVVAATTKTRFVRLSGIESNVAEMRKELAAAAEYQRAFGQTSLLFVDEIHRFNKNQQDILLPEIENGRIRFIGATTHNPFFYINGPLVSRSQIFQLEPVSEEDLLALLRRALADPERGFGALKIQADDDALAHLAKLADGDARRTLQSLELAVLSTPSGPDGRLHLTLEVAQESIQRKAVQYDASDDQHYDTISAFIKSIRGGDPDAALYWLAKMLYAGEDPRFIARRLVISASEDIGMADPQGLLIATAAQNAVETVGLPEARINLAHATVHLATAPKSNRAYAALGKAMEDIENGRTLEVPKALRSTFKGSKAFGHGEGYQYSHDSEEGYIPQAFLPEGRRYYEPTDRGYEKRVAERLAYWRQLYEESVGK